MRRERTGRQTHSGELDRPWESQTYSQTDRLKNKNRRTNRQTDCQGRTESGKNQGGRTDRQTSWVAHKQTERNDEITYQGTAFDSCISSKQSHWYCNQKSQIKVKIFFAIVFSSYFYRIPCRLTRIRQINHSLISSVPYFKLLISIPCLIFSIRGPLCFLFSPAFGHSRVKLFKAFILVNNNSQRAQPPTHPPLVKKYLFRDTPSAASCTVLLSSSEIWVTLSLSSPSISTIGRDLSSKKI